MTGRKTVHWILWWCGLDWADSV